MDHPPESLGVSSELISDLRLSGKVALALFPDTRHSVAFFVEPNALFHAWTGANFMLRFSVGLELDVF